MLHNRTQRLQRSDFHEKQGSVEGGLGGNVISYQPNSLFTNPVCPHPWKLWPCIETTWLSADQPVSAAALWYQEWRVLRGGAGKWSQKPSVAVREWGYLPCSLRWRLISHVACACIHTSVQLHKHAYTQLVQKFEGWRVCIRFLGDKWGLFVKHSEHDTKTRAVT